MMKIREELPGDENAIHDLTVQAFEGMPYSNGEEAPIVRRLRDDGDLVLSLVAVDEGMMVGHVAFSPVAINQVNNGWCGLGPLSIRPDRQRTGIGSRLVREGLSRMKKAGASGCVLIGNPDYYSRFGFVSNQKLFFGKVPFPYVQSLCFGEQPIAGKLRFAPAFGG